MTTPALRTDIDLTEPDDANDPTVKEHQEAHDRLAQLHNDQHYTGSGFAEHFLHGGY